MSDNPYQPPNFEPRPPQGYPTGRRTDGMTLKSVGVLSVGKVMACLYALLGLIVGGFVSLFSLAGLATGGPNGAGANLFFGAAAIVLLPAMYGVMGFVGGIIMAALYNFVASLVGGIELELKSSRGDGG